MTGIEPVVGVEIVVIGTVTVVEGVEIEERGTDVEVVTGRSVVEVEIVMGTGVVVEAEIGIVAGVPLEVGTEIVIVRAGWALQRAMGNK